MTQPVPATLNPTNTRRARFRGPDGEPWLDEARISAALAELRSVPAGPGCWRSIRVRKSCCRAGSRSPDSTGGAFIVWVLVQLLADERLRAEFDVALRAFRNTFDTVLPRPEALPFVNDVTLFAEIQIRTRRRYRDTPDGDFDPHKYKEKIRRLIDQHITSLDLSQKIPPARITDPEFRNSTGQIGSARAKASEMEHAVRHHIREHLHEDPAYYDRLSQRIDDILDRLQERWEQMALEFQELIADINAGRTDEDHTGLDPATELAFHSQMADKVTSSSPVGADYSVVGVDLQRCQLMLIPRVPNLVPIPGITRSAHCAIRPLQGPRDHRLAPPARRAATTSRSPRPHR